MWERVQTLWEGVWTMWDRVQTIWDRVCDATHGSLALKAYQQNLYLKYYY